MGKGAGGWEKRVYIFGVDQEEEDGIHLTYLKTDSSPHPISFNGRAKSLK